MSGADASTSDPQKEDVKKLTELVMKINQKTFGLTKFSTEFSHAAHEEIVSKTISKWTRDFITIITSAFEARSVSVNLKMPSLQDKHSAIKEGADIILDSLSNHLDEVEGYKKPTSTEDTVASRMPTPTSFKSPRSNGSYKLPQTRFADKVDNSTEPFLPALDDKPHSLKPLAMILSVDPLGKEFYPHPYSYELQHYTVPKEQLCSRVPTRYEENLHKTPLLMVETGDDLRKMIAELSQFSTIAVDLEAHSYHSYQGLTCLVQISSAEKDYIVDPLKLKQIPGLKLWSLNEVFANPKIMKVLHGAESDIVWLQRDFSVYVVNMLDTHQACISLDYPQRSLASLLLRHCGVATDKSYQRSDWRTRPLPANFIKYARMDTHYLLYIGDTLINELIEKDPDGGLLLDTFQKSTAICELRYEKPRIYADSHMPLVRKSRKTFDNRQIYACKQLFAWRDQIARREDESPSYVLPERMLLEIACTLPKEVQGIFACCNPIPSLVRQERLSIHEIIKEATKKSLEQVSTELKKVEPLPNQEFVADFHRMTSIHDLSQVDPNRRDLPTLLSREDVIDAPCSFKKETSNFFWTKEVKKPAIECNVLTPYQRYVSYMEMKPLLQKAAKDKVSKTNEQRVTKVLDYIRSLGSKDDPVLDVEALSLETSDANMEGESEEAEVKVETPKFLPWQEDRFSLKERAQLANPNNRHKDKIGQKRKWGEQQAPPPTATEDDIQPYDYSQEDGSLFERQTPKGTQKKKKKDVMVIQELFKANKRGTSTTMRPSSGQTITVKRHK